MLVNVFVAVIFTQAKHSALLYLKDPTNLSIGYSFALTRSLLNFLEVLNKIMDLGVNTLLTS